MKINQLFVFFLLLKTLAFAQKPPTVPPEIHIKRAVGKVTLDGKLDDATWQTAQKSSPFWQSYPYDTTFSTAKSEVQLAFDDVNLYVGAKCFQKKNSYVVQSLKRDFPPGTTDLFSVLLDPFGDKTSGFSFAVSALGVQREGLIANGNEFSTDWDNRWFSKTVNYDDFYIVELAIPFKSLRYRTLENGNEWLIQFLRFDQSQAQPERSTWSPLPRFSSGNNLAFSGKLIWDDAPPRPTSRNIVLIPYALGSISKDLELKKPQNTEGALGFDAKVAVSSSLNLDLTANPDFAQVEVDQQQTNLSRFELFFPEKRQFFIENSDLFGRFGFDNINPFFSRRIGLARDAAGNSVKVPIIGGARLTGKLDKNWRIGLLDVQTAGRADLKIAASNFLAAAVQRQVFGRSNVAFIVVNKENFLTDSTGKNLWELNRQNFNRVIGLDYNLASKNDHWQGKAFVHRSVAATPQYQPYSAGVFVNYNVQNFNFTEGVEAVGKGYTGEAVGYVPRHDYYRTLPNVNWVIYPKHSKQRVSYRIGADGDFFWRLGDGRFTDYDFSPVVFAMNFKNNSGFNLTPVRWDYTYLFDAFDPTNSGGKRLAAGSAYTYKTLRINYYSDTRHHFSYTLSGRFGEYFNGNIVAVAATAAYRWQPYGVFSLNVNYNRITLPEGFNSRQLLLVGPKFDLSFSRNVFFTTFIQYNNQINNVNVNARFQWRFAPVSDLFLVYTDNYFAETDAASGFHAFDSKNRAVVLKCTYWLNL